MTPHFLITYIEKCGVIPHTTIIQNMLSGMNLHITFLLFRKECAG